MIFKKGDKVRFLNETGEGIIMGFGNKYVAIVEIADGFEIPYPVNELVKMGFEEVKQETVAERPKTKIDIKGVKKIFLEKEEKGIRRDVSKKHRKNIEVVEEIDLHIEQLMDNFRGMSNGEIIQVQLSRFVNHLEAGIKNRTNKIVFIHGVGNGVLKAGIRNILDGYSNLVYHDASYAKYGFGATEVIIKY
ncbi:MAG: DNA mismatch repair protein MutS [Bacteroidetes bacterium]|nr:DNA mismatch repair protein MutS [Bacteroidota bacterium]HET6243327.1 Smr/MutS family protein [Bacteroidia bacterium]